MGNSQALIISDGKRQSRACVEEYAHGKEGSGRRRLEGGWSMEGSWISGGPCSRCEDPESLLYYMSASGSSTWKNFKEVTCEIVKCTFTNLESYYWLSPLEKSSYHHLQKQEVEGDSGEARPGNCSLKPTEGTWHAAHLTSH